MNNLTISGTGTAVVTPFTPGGEVDYPALEKILDYQTHNGIDFLVALGTTGEAVTLSEIEKERVISVFKQNKNGLPLVVGMGGNNTQAVCETIGNTDFDGIDAILSVVPYYNKPSQRGIYLHFSAIVSVAPVPVILYNVPGRTGTNMTASTALQLSRDFNSIIAVKEASGNMQQIMELLRNKSDTFAVLSGDDALTFPMIQLGASGVISVVSNVFPLLFSEMVMNSRGGNDEKALQIHYQLLEFIELLFKEGSPPGIKAALECMGLCNSFVRLPLAPVSEQLKEKIALRVNEIFVK
ncbi:MAG: 4-hydroxy-tetrahydrodipicolinate synthase [Bacteroidales bacterium]|nr:4-hydroxy-tetrahydrodipicolinate synthase [Bacteroidales bacterium]NCC74456.1 4-hydroxy-tetrahydrodipicolinate synthase [Sphingobacteriia bacterium]MDD2322318.1 4-hydroxy-tetrahydrodipicolinate synthase [Bacteroidales bacterium]MDD3009896.1 4-hydroxy-tetrahydrodipicolinate synthase [Bacteroidales bacterium]MDD3961457.1 4-hydroxy-tetrahydrodipicolinate synthase [Bacteroidales bacterium]